MNPSRLFLKCLAFVVGIFGAVLAVGNVLFLIWFALGQQTTDRAKLSSDLKNRIEAMKRVQSLADVSKTANDAVVSAKTVTDTRIKSYAKLLSSVAQSISSAVQAVITDAKLEAGVLVAITKEGASDEEVATEAEKINAALATLSETLFSEETKKQKAVNLHASIKTQYETEVAQKADRAANTELAARLSHALKIVEDT